VVGVGHLEGGTTNIVHIMKPDPFERKGGISSVSGEKEGVYTGLGGEISERAVEEATYEDGLPINRNTSIINTKTFGIRSLLLKRVEVVKRLTGNSRLACSYIPPRAGVRSCLLKGGCGGGGGGGGGGVGGLV